MEEAHRSQDSDHPDAPGGDHSLFGDVIGGGGSDWAAPAGIVAGSVICVTLLVVVSLVIRKVSVALQSAHSNCQSIREAIDDDEFVT